MKKVLMFVLFNVILNGMDVATDLSTFLKLIWDGQHWYWASLTLTWMLTPFLIHCLGFFANLMWTKFDRPKRGYIKEFYYEAGVHFPFILPLVNLWRAKELSRLGFGTASFKSENTEAVEKILNEAAHASYSESFYEAGPQSVTQVNSFFYSSDTYHLFLKSRW